MCSRQEKQSLKEIQEEKERFDELFDNIANFTAILDKDSPTVQLIEQNSIQKGTEKKSEEKNIFVKEDKVSPVKVPYPQVHLNKRNNALLKKTREL